MLTALMWWAVEKRTISATFLRILRPCSAVLLLGAGVHFLWLAKVNGLDPNRAPAPVDSSNRRALAHTHLRPWAGGAQELLSSKRSQLGEQSTQIRPSRAPIHRPTIRPSVLAKAVSGIALHGSRERRPEGPTRWGNGSRTPGRTGALHPYRRACSRRRKRVSRYRIRPPRPARPLLPARDAPRGPEVQHVGLPSKVRRRDPAAAVQTFEAKVGRGAAHVSRARAEGDQAEKREDGDGGNEEQRHAHEGSSTPLGSLGLGGLDRVGMLLGVRRLRVGDPTMPRSRLI